MPDPDNASSENREEINGTNGKESDANENKDDKKGGKQPPGGFTDTPVPRVESGYTLRFTFIRAKNLPMADLTSLASDPFVHARLTTTLPTRHKEDPVLSFRTPTIQRETEPEWNASWVVANIPNSGFKMKARIMDEDPADHNDRLGSVHVYVDCIDDKWPGIHEQAFKIRKRSGSKRAYALRGCAAMFSRGYEMNGELIVSVEMLGRTKGEGGRVYTVGPNYWNKHYSPLIGRLTGTKEPEKDKNDGGKMEKFNFQANQIQLTGPVPAELYHRYVEFKKVIGGMFSKSGLRGRILNKALHHQHARIYNFDKATEYGCILEPGRELALQFLDMVHYDQGGRIFTYVLTLDGLLRFTETGKEFGIDLLSKHSMHSDVAIYIAWSGEFFVRRLKDPSKAPDAPGQKSHPPDDIGHGPPESEPPKEPEKYELIIDNDSGTYRPKKELLPLLGKFLEKNFQGLKIKAMACDDDALDKMKEEQRKLKKSEGDTRTFVQHGYRRPGSSQSSISSSDERELQQRAEQGEDAPKKKGPMEMGLDVLSEPKDAVQGIVEEVKPKGKREREEREERDDHVSIVGQEEREKGKEEKEGKQNGEEHHRETNGKADEKQDKSEDDKEHQKLSDNAAK